VQVLEADVLRQPLGERVERQRLVRRAQVLPALLRHQRERVLRAAPVAALLLQHLGGLARQRAVLDQPVDDLGERQAMLGGGLGGGLGHGRGHYTARIGHAQRRHPRPRGQTA
jgi:hypothetical protein